MTTVKKGIMLFSYSVFSSSYVSLLIFTHLLSFIWFKILTFTIVKLIFEDCKGDKFEFINKVKEIAAETKRRVDARLVYEDKIMRIWGEGKPLEDEKEAWIEYIQFEIAQGMPKRAKLLYERGLISLDKDRHFWISFI